MTAVRTRGRQSASASRSAVASPRAKAAAAPSQRSETTLRVHTRRVVSARVLIAFSMALFFVLVAGGVAIQAQRVEAQHQLDQLRDQLAAEHDLNRGLRADVAVAESPERVIEAARSLHLVTPGPVVPLVPTLAPTAPTEPTNGDDGG